MPMLVHAPPRTTTRQDRELALFERLRAGDADAREAIAHLFLPLAYKLARRYHGHDPDDLNQVAAIGLLKAIDRFDASRGLAFSTYAFPTIVGELKRYFRDRTWSVHVPRSLQELTLRVDRGTAAFVTAHGRTPTVAELAERLRVTDEQVVEALQSVGARHADSLDRTARDSDDHTVGDHLAVDDPSFDRVDDALFLDGLLRSLPPRDQRIVLLRFRDDLQQSEIARRVGRSQMHVSRTLRLALERLRETAEDKE